MTKVGFLLGVLALAVGIWAAGTYVAPFVKDQLQKL